MSGKIEISRELAEHLTSSDTNLRNQAMYVLRALLAASDMSYRIKSAACDNCASSPCICSEIAAPVVERQPVAVITGVTSRKDSKFQIVILDNQELHIGTKLYTSPPAPVAAVLPERRNDDCDRSSPNSWTDWGMGWNACLDKVKELNQ